LVLNDSTGVVEVINNLNRWRSEIDKASPLLLQSFDFSTLYTKIELVDLKAHMRVLISKVFNRMLKLHCFKFLMVQKTTLDFRFLWLKNKAEINLFENLRSFKVAEASDLISWLDFLLDNLFLCFGQGVYRQCIGIQDSFGSGIYPKTSCELNCMSKGFSCNFLDLTLRQSPQGLSCDIFDKRSQPEYAGIEMIRMPQVHSNISMTAKLGVINSQFYRFLRLCSCKKFFVFQIVSLIVFLKAKGYPLKVLLKRTRGLVLKENFLFEISAFGIFRMILLRVM